MISFIIIGRNEGWKLINCLNSVFKTIAYNKLDNYEVIYIDSKSTDNSIEIAKSFQQINIYQLIADYNAAIARNLGAEKSTGDVLFFIDGDMEIIPYFLPVVYCEVKGLVKQYVSGNFINYNYDINGSLIEKEKYKTIVKDSYEFEVGGLFLIDKKIWLEVGGMRNIFKKSQDIDLSLRLAKKGTKLIRKKELAAIHHTIPYMNKKRMWQDLFNGFHLYSRSLLYRKNIVNIYMYKRLLRNDYSLVILFILIVILMFNVNITFLAFYILVMVIRSRLNVEKLFYYFLRDFSSLLGSFFFFPKRKFNISDRQIG